MAVEVAAARQCVTWAELHRWLPHKALDASTQDVLLLTDVADNSLPYDRSNDEAHPRLLSSAVAAIRPGLAVAAYVRVTDLTGRTLPGNFP